MCLQGTWKGMPLSAEQHRASLLEHLGEDASQCTERRKMLSHSTVVGLLFVGFRTT